VNYTDVLNAWISAKHKRNGTKVEGFCVDANSKRVALKANNGKIEWIVINDYNLKVNSNRVLKRTKPDWPGAII
jgi:hypothetical protein